MTTTFCIAAILIAAYVMAAQAIGNRYALPRLENRFWQMMAGHIPIAGPEDFCHFVRDLQQVCRTVTWKEHDPSSVWIIDKQHYLARHMRYCIGKREDLESSFGIWYEHVEKERLGFAATQGPAPELTSLFVWRLSFYFRFGPRALHRTEPNMRLEAYAKFFPRLIWPTSLKNLLQADASDTASA